MTIYSPASEIRHTLVRLPEETPSLDLLGVRIKTLVSSADTGGAWALIDYTAPPLFRGPIPHWHGRTAELFHVLEGTLTMWLEGRTIHLPVGGSVLVPPGTLHQFSNTSPDPVRFLAQFSPGGLEDYFLELAELVAEEPIWPPADPSRVLALAERYDTYSPTAL